MDAPARERSGGPPGVERRPRAWARVALVLAVVAASTAVLGFGLSRDPSVLRPSLVGEPAPDFSLRSLDGSETIHLSKLRGQVVVINFWASWCAECRQEHPDLQAAWARYRDRGVVLLGIPFQDVPADSRRYAQEMGGDWPLLLDPGSRTGLAYGVYGVPETVFVGPDGRVAGKVIGPIDYRTLSARISSLLREGSG